MTAESRNCRQSRLIVYSKFLKEVCCAVLSKIKLATVWLSPNGAIAQLVERLLCKQDVDGSNPSGSTIKRLTYSKLRMISISKTQFIALKETSGP